MAPPPPGWYPDPWWAGSIRYWDGRAWTTQAAWSNGPVPPPPLPPLTALRAPAFWVTCALVAACVVVGRLLNGQLVRTVTTLRSFEALQWGFYVFVYGGMAAAVVFVTRRYGSGSVRDALGLGFRWSDLGWGPILFVAGRMVQLAVTVPLVVVPVLRHSSQRYSDVMRAQPTEMLVTLVVVGVVVAPIVEELVFRGALLRGLLAHCRAPVAAVIQGVLFGCYHFAPDLGYYNIVLITANGALGVLFGFVALRRRSLGTGIVAHAITNASAMIIVFATR